MIIIININSSPALERPVRALTDFITTVYFTFFFNIRTTKQNRLESARLNILKNKRFAWYSFCCGLLGDLWHMRWRTLNIEAEKSDSDSDIQIILQCVL